MVSGMDVYNDTWSGAFYNPGTRDGKGIPGSYQPRKFCDDFSFDASRVVPTANVDRPINRAVRYFIKAA